MMKRNWSSLALTIAAATVSATTASAISLDFIGVPGGGNIGPYSLQITGDVAILGPPALKALPNGLILGVCNDVAGTVSGTGVGNAWTVQKHALFNSTTNNIGSLEKGKWDGAGSPSTNAKFFESTPADNFLDATLRDYKAGAWLANRVLNNVGGATGRANAQHALWGLFQTNYALTATQSALKTAAYTAIDSGWNGWQTFAVYTKVPLGSAPPGGTQEFYVNVPEASSVASLGLYFGGLGLLGYAFRRRMKLTN